MQSAVGTGASETRDRVITIRDLSITFETDDGVVNALDHINLELLDGETLGILGESGSGKTTLATAIISLLPENAMVTGEVNFQDETVTSAEFSGKASRRLKRKTRNMLSEKLRNIRWKGISMVFQGSMNAFNPVYTIERQIGEAYRLHTDMDEEQIHESVVETVKHAGLNPSVLTAYPHELSGGMKQRAVIAMALALKPRLVIADEPTTGLDVITQARIIFELKKLKKSDIDSMIVISHDIGVVAQLADRVAIMYAGRIMEIGSIGDIYESSGNPYTRALLESYPSIAKSREMLAGIPGSPPDPISPPSGCRFAPRCIFANDICSEKDPPLVEVEANHFSACHFASDVFSGKLTAANKFKDRVLEMRRMPPSSLRPLIRTEGLSKFFDIRSTLFGAVFSSNVNGKVVRAVDDITVEIGENEVFGIVGESGSGKTTLGKTLLALLKPTGGKLFFRLKAVDTGSQEANSPFIDVGSGELGDGGKNYRSFRRQTQMIFQDPYDSLDPKMTVFDIVQEPVIAHKVTRNPNKVVELVNEALITVNLRPPENYLDRFPHELSGGERQRVAAARALVLKPEFLIADEPISMLDVSLRAGFMNLLLNLRDNLGLTIVYITHDIASARYLADRILVMYLGVGVELSETEGLLKNPLHPYTKALIQAVPVPTPNWNPGALEIMGDIGNAVNVPAGCRFSDRCVYRQDMCRDTPPPKIEIGNHWYLCHFTQQQLTQIKEKGSPKRPG